MQLILAEVARLGILLRSASLGAKVCLRRVHLVNDCDRHSEYGERETRERVIGHSLAYSSTIFFLARSKTSSSIVSLLTNRYTLTCDFCPIRCARAIACRSFCGFQSLYRG